MNAIQKKRAQYLGTRIAHKWWRRYCQGGFFIHGIGEYWIKDGSLFFKHRTRQEPISLPIRDIVGIILCSRKRRIWGDVVPVIKLVWRKDNVWLSSDFAFPGNSNETNHMVASLRTELASIVS